MLILVLGAVGVVSNAVMMLMMNPDGLTQESESGLFFFCRLSLLIDRFAAGISLYSWNMNSLI